MPEDLEDHSEEIKALRKTFAELYKDNIKKKVYDERDLKRFNEQDAYTLRFIFHQRFDIKKAAAMIDSSLKFRQEYSLNDLNESSFERWMHDLGAVYYRNKDKEGHDILFFQVCRTKKDADNLLKVKQFIAWWIDKSFSKWPDKQIVVLFDMTNVGLSNVDIDLIKYQVACFATYFPGMLAYMLVYEMPWVLNALWKLIKNLLTPEQQKKVLFVKKNEVQQYIDAENLPAHMGGTDEFEYTYLPSEDSGIEIPNDDVSPESLIPNSDVSDTGMVVSGSPIGDAFNSLAPSSDDTSQLCTSSSATTSSVRKRVTFSDQGDSHKYSSENTKSGSSAMSSASNSNQTEFQNEIVSIRPAELVTFHVVDSSRETVETINVTNTSTNIQAFKIKTTNPESFRVRPSTGLMRPGETVDISVYLQSDSIDTVARQKFLVMLLKVEEGTKLSHLTGIWKNHPTDPEIYFEHRLWCRLRTGTESQHQDSLSRCEEVLTTITKQVSEIMQIQKRVERRQCRLYTFQMVLLLILFSVAICLFVAFILDFFPFAPPIGGINACTPYLRRS